MAFGEAWTSQTGVRCIHAPRLASAADTGIHSPQTISYKPPPAHAASGARKPGTTKTGTKGDRNVKKPAVNSQPEHASGWWREDIHRYIEVNYILTHLQTSYA